MADRDLLGMLVGVQTATRLYQGSLSKLLSSRDQQHPVLAAAQELIRRGLEEQMQSRSALSAPALVKDYLRLHFIGREYESFMVLYLDAQHRLIQAAELFRGTLTQTSVYPREVVKAALQANAAAVILAHNHPSGVAEPSRADGLWTQVLKNALALVDIQVLDHIVVAGPATVSFAERGEL